MIKRIVLIESGVTNPGSFVYHVYPPHGLMYIAACLRAQRPEIEIKIFDLMIRKQPETAILEELKEFSPDLAGIHAMHFQAKFAHRAAAMIKDHLKVPVVIGGPYPSSDAETALADANIDLAVRGEGEITFVELVERLDRGQDLSGLAGLSHRKDGQLTNEQDRELIADLDQIPFPAWDLIELEKFFDWKVLVQNELRWQKEVATIFTSRACPYGCIFCHNMFGKKFRARSPENVVSEMRLLHDKYGVREIHIIDDCFNFELERAKQICRLIIASGLDLKLAFPNGIRGDRLDRELVDLLKAAGVYKLTVGVESGSERVQKMIRKNIDLEKLKANIEMVAKAGIFVHGFFMMGFPGETAAEIEQTIAFAVSSKLHTAGFALLKPFPKTRVREIAEEMGKRVSFESEDATYTQLACNLSQVSDEQLLAYHRSAYWKFHFSPSRLWRIFWATPRKRMLPRVFWAHLRTKFL